MTEAILTVLQFRESLVRSLLLGVPYENVTPGPRERSTSQTKRKLADHKLEEIEGITVTDTGMHRSGIVLFLHYLVPATRLVAQLAAKNIVVRMSPRFGTRLDKKLSALDDLVRASVHYYNTDDEVDRFCDTLASLVNSL